MLGNNRPEEKLKTFPSRLSFPTSEFVSIIFDWRQYCRSGGECRQTFPFKSQTWRDRQEGHLGRFFARSGLGWRAERSCSVLSFSSKLIDSTMSALAGQCILGLKIKILSVPLYYGCFLFSNQNFKISPKSLFFIVLKGRNLRIIVQHENYFLV